MSWRHRVGVPGDVLDKDFTELDPEFQDLVLEHRARLREPFEENDEKQIPQHPYKIYSRLRKEEGVYDKKFMFADRRVLAIQWALDYLKEKYEEKWRARLKH